ncbi:GyrI-like domain-containing protein [Edaphobacter albus]|uniref:GyrI-like domain-containing protein n=1 Tax=Edaphobacter sp. 4G125 TaxID=2763071 RepID=UPI0016451BD1|nr:GyrI-like domain-containing protein [Edaphobacter sp. 4G125]QNI36481.1 GyrI-like domain-containing protein [Edaphobacter sp. 4G125]
MNLTIEPEIVTQPTTHYVFIEKIGPFLNTAAQAWQELHHLEPAISKHNKISGAMALYKIGPKVYRAGFLLAAAPEQLPPDVQSIQFGGGKYSRFVLTGSYSNLPEASGRVWSIVGEKKIPLRDDFTIEHYTNDPKTTPEDKLVTEILIPTA